LLQIQLIIRALVENKILKEIFKGIFCEEPATLETKWVRVLGNKEATDTHSVIILYIPLI
jgi:hypothetical protein